MSEPVLILGKSGSGKSSGIRSLPPEKTFLFNVCGKELPFKGARSYVPLSNGNGNMVITDDYDVIHKTIHWLESNRPQTEYIIFDDSQYLLVNEFMKNHAAKGKGNDVFQLYNSIGGHFWNLLWQSKFLKMNAKVFFLHHAETTDLGEIKAKSIGKMLDDKVDIPGMFTCVFLARREGNKNYFFTQNDGSHPAKTPIDMFADLKIDNDLLLVANTIKQYYEEERK
jgi:hypothetical protein